MQILILIDVQYLQNGVSGFEKTKTSISMKMKWKIVFLVTAF